MAAPVSVSPPSSTAKPTRRSLRRELVNLPNMITYLRIALVPVVTILLWQGDPWSCYVASLVYTVAAVSDLIDGWLARRWNLITTVGKFLDPLADKLLVICVLLVLIPQERCTWWLAALIILRDVTINGLRSIATSEGIIIAAGVGGKYKTAFQMAGLPGLMIHYTYWVNLGFAEVRVDFHALGMALTTVSVAFGLVSGLLYVWDFFMMLRQRRLSADGAQARAT